MNCLPHFLYVESSLIFYSTSMVFTFFERGASDTCLYTTTYICIVCAFAVE